MTAALPRSNAATPTSGAAAGWDGPGAIDAIAPESLYRRLLEQGPPFYLAGRDGQLRFASASFQELAQEIADCGAVDLAEQLVLPQIMTELDRRDDADRTERELAIPGTPRRHFTIRHRAVRDDRGRLVGICGTLDEINGDAAALRELAMAQERLDDITRLVSDWVWETDGDLALSLVSPRAVEMLECHPRELVGRRFVEFGTFPEGEPSFIRARDLRQPPPFRDIPFCLVRRDGTRRLLRLSGLPVFSSMTEEFIGYRGTARDVTQETEAGERVAQSRGRLIEAIESISEGFALFDADEHLVLCNSKYRSMFPTSAELLQPGIAFADFIRAVAERGGIVLGDETPEAWCARQRELRERGPVSFELKLGDGRWVKVGDRKAGDGSIVCILTDISELKRREEALSVAKEFAETASRSKSEFLANISHELRTPLNAIIGFTEIMRDEIFGPVGSRQYRDYLGDILDSARRLLDVINDILDVAKAEAGKLDLDEEEVDIGAVIRATTALVQERAQHSRLTIGILGVTAVPIVYADERKLKQILLNLLTNAIKFTPAGGRVEVIANVDAAGDFVLEIVDTGIGIAPEHIATALAPFGQVDGTLSRKYEGTGLGLPLTRAMVELHGGALSIASRVREGTTVTVRLPAARVRAQFDYDG